MPSRAIASFFESLVSFAYTSVFVQPSSINSDLLYWQLIWSDGLSASALREDQRQKSRHKDLLMIEELSWLSMDLRFPSISLNRPTWALKLDVVVSSEHVRRERLRSCVLSDIVRMALYWLDALQSVIVIVERICGCKMYDWFIDLWHHDLKLAAVPEIDSETVQWEINAPRRHSYWFLISYSNWRVQSHHICVCLSTGGKSLSQILSIGETILMRVICCKGGCCLPICELPDVEMWSAFQSDVWSTRRCISCVSMGFCLGDSDSTPSGSSHRLINIT